MDETNEEIADDGSDKEEVVEDETLDEKADEDGAEDDESIDDDSNDDAPLPKTRKELDAAIAKAVADGIKSSRNRNGADRRNSKDGRNLPDRKGPKVEDQVADLQKWRQDAEAAEAKRQFGYDNSLSPSEVDIVFRFAKKPTEKTLSDPIVQGALNGYRTSNRARNNIPSTKGPSFGANNKDYKDLKPEEKAAHFTARRTSLLEGRKGR